MGVCGCVKEREKEMGQGREKVGDGRERVGSGRERGGEEGWERE